jgi:hypothetical protein
MQELVFGFFELVFFTSRKPVRNQRLRFSKSKTTKAQRESSMSRYWSKRDSIRKYWRDLPTDRKLIRNARSRAWRAKNKKLKREADRAWRKKNKWRVWGYKQTPNQKISGNIQRFFKDRKASGIRQLASATKLIGVTLAALAKHIESQFRDGMSWDNHGIEWEFDHLQPRSSFDLSALEGQKAADHFTNWQPLFISERQAKMARERIAKRQ